MATLAEATVAVEVAVLPNNNPLRRQRAAFSVDMAEDMTCKKGGNNTIATTRDNNNLTLIAQLSQSQSRLESSMAAATFVGQMIIVHTNDETATSKCSTIVLDGGQFKPIKCGVRNKNIQVVVFSSCYSVERIAPH